MKNQKIHTSCSKFLSLVLRHKPDTIGLRLSQDGWVSTDELLAQMNAHGKEIDLALLTEIVDTNSKKRFSFNSDKSMIRANQGHSLEVNLGYTPVQPPSLLYHGTAQKNMESILASGLKKRNRHHVHLSKDSTTARTVGSRHGKPVILVIDTAKMHEDGHHFFVSENGVWLTDHVPAKYFSVEE